MQQFAEFPDRRQSECHILVGTERFVEDNLAMRRRREGGRLQNGSRVVVHQVLAGEHEFVKR